MTPKTITLFLVIILAFLILIGLFRQINSAITASKRLDQAADTVSKLQDTNRQLRGKLNEVKSYDFVEKVLRDKLGLSKPNETIIVVPKEQVAKVIAGSQKIEPIPTPNWQGWFKLLKVSF